MDGKELHLHEPSTAEMLQLLLHEMFIAMLRLLLHEMLPAGLQKL